MGKYKIYYHLQQDREAIVEGKNEEEAKENFNNGNCILEDICTDEHEYNFDDIEPL